MNILFINETQVNESQGGVQRVTQILADFFTKNEIEVFYLFCKSDKNESFKNNNEYRFPVTRISSKNNKKLLEEIVCLNKIDIIINQYGFNPKILKLLTNINSSIPIISCLHSGPDFEIKNAEIELSKSLDKKYPLFLNLKILLKPFYLFLLKKKVARKLKYIYLNSTVTILLSHKFIPSFLKLTKIINSEKLKAIGNPINPRFNLSDTFVLEKAKSVLYVGRLSKGKRVDLLLPIWQKLQKDFPEWNFDIVGDGPELNHLQKLSKSLNLKNITFHGQSNDVKLYYLKASIFVSTSAFEGLPMVLNEAQIFGTVPIVYNTYESITDLIIDNNTGYIIPNLNQEFFVNKLSYLMESGEHRDKMGNKAIEFAKKSDIEQIGKEWMTLFDHVNK